MRKWLLIVPFLFIMLSGCPKNDPTKPSAAVSPTNQPELTPEEKLVRRKAAAQCKRAELDERIKQDKAVMQIASIDKDACEEEARQQDLAWWKKLCWWIGLGGIIGGIVALGVILYFTKNVKLATTIAGALGAIAVLSFGIMWVLAHFWLTVGIVAAIVGLGILIKVFGYWQTLKDGAQILANGTKNKAEDFVEQLARAKVHDLDSFKLWYESLKK
jgi:hypothetical protein